MILTLISPDNLRNGATYDDFAEIIHGSHMYILFLTQVGLYVTKS
jgi:hypothetical protein